LGAKCDFSLLFTVDFAGQFHLPCELFVAARFRSKIQTIACRGVQKNVLCAARYVLTYPTLY